MWVNAANFIIPAPLLVLALLDNHNSSIKILKVRLAYTRISPVKRWSLTELNVDKGAVHCLPGTKTMPGISLDSMKILIFYIGCTK